MFILSGFIISDPDFLLLMMPVSLIKLLFQLLVYERSEEDTSDSISIMGTLIGNCIAHVIWNWN